MSKNTNEIEIVEVLERHVAAFLLENYDDYCPLVPIYGSFTDNGTKFYTETESGYKKFTSNKLIERPGFLVLEIGSEEEEFTVNAAASAVYGCLESLFTPCGGPVKYERIRTGVELEEYLKRYRENYSHIIIIGHGSKGGIKFLDKASLVGGHGLVGLLGADGSTRPIQIISLCCHSGCDNISEALSKAEGVTEVIAPKSEFDLRWAAHFISGYFLNQFLNGLTIERSVCDAITDKKATPMTIWKEGRLIFDCDK